MPNWCESDLFVYGEGREAIVERLKFENKAFSLQRILPMPACLKTTECGSVTDTAAMILGIKSPSEHVGTLIQRYPGWQEKSRQNQLAYAETGYWDWYEWANANWGVKWDASMSSVEIQPTRVKFKFQTPWGPPKEELFVTLSKEYPALRFSLRYYEMGQQFKGHTVFKNGEILKTEQGTYKGKRGG